MPSSPVQLRYELCPERFYVILWVRVPMEVARANANQQIPRMVWEMLNIALLS